MNFEAGEQQNDSNFAFFGSDVVALSRQKQTVQQSQSGSSEIEEAMFGGVSDDGYSDIGDNGSDSGVEAVEPTGPTSQAVPFGKRMPSSTSLLSAVTNEVSRTKRPPSVTSSASKLSKASKASSSRTLSTGPKRSRLAVSGFDSDADQDSEMQSRRDLWGKQVQYERRAEEGDSREMWSTLKRTRRFKPVDWA